MPFSLQNTRVPVADRMAVDLPWAVLKELTSAFEPLEGSPVEWVLDHARSTDGARP